MLLSGCAQLLIGGVLQGEQGVVGTRESPEDLVELALRRPLVARLGVLDDEEHREGKRGHQGLEDGLPPRRETGGDADDDPHPGGADGEHCGQRPRGVPVDPGQPSADRGSLAGRP
jgi:hypothetical protein